MNTPSTPTPTPASLIAASLQHPHFRGSRPLLSPDAPGDTGGAGGTAPLPPGGVISPPVPPKTSEGSGKSETGGGIDDRVHLTREEYDKLSGSAKEADSLRDVWESTRTLIEGGAERDKAVEATRKILARTGRSQADIDSFIEEKYPSQEPKGGRKGAEEDDATEKRFKTLESRLEQEKLVRFQGVLSNSTAEALEGNAMVVKIVDHLAQINVEDGDETKVAKYKGELAREMMDACENETKRLLAERRRLAGGRFEEGWIAEEAVKAAAKIESKYRRYVGDPSRLGRSAETDPVSERLAREQPVKAPEHKNGMTHGEAQSGLRTWATDMLLRGAAEEGTFKGARQETPA